MATRHLKIEEPKFISEMTTIQLMNSLNWYHQNKEYKEGVNYIQDYAKKHRIEGRVNTSKSILTLAWVCRLVMNGNDVGEKGRNFLNAEIRNVMQKEVEEVSVKVDTTPTVSIQERLREKVAEIAGDLEGAIDDYIENDFTNPASPFAIMQDRAKGVHAQRLIEQFKKRRIEFDEVLHTKDVELKEGYGNFTKPQLKKVVAWCDQVILDCQKVMGSAAQNRKPRKRKVKSPEELVVKIKVLDKFDELKLVSVPATEIIGAMQLWVYNVKTRKLGCYHAEDAGGLSVKGTSLINFNETKSVQKKLRKPEVTLPEVLKGGKIYLRSAIDNIKAVDSALTGRINGDTILVRCIR
mgnify:CR=1 FL=1